MHNGAACPCGTGLSYGDCCGRLHSGRVRAATAEELMRSRYSAFVVGDEEYLLATWHPDTRPSSVNAGDGCAWTGLTIVASSENRVEFIASYVGGQIHEDSRFLRGPDGWVYVRGRQR